MSKVLNAKQTAEYIGRSMNNTLDMLHAGMIPAIRTDRRWMIDQNVLDQWLLNESKRQAEVRRTQCANK